MAAALAGVAGSCAVDPGANPSRRCDEETPCPAPMECYRGFCVGDGAEPCGEPGAVRPCYEGPEGTRTVGRCKEGAQECDGETWGSCLGQVLPADTETCDGEDDDCDGAVDEVESTSCDTGLAGLCMLGSSICRGTEMACDRARDPAAEACNSQDDDCDGSVDEGTDRPCYPDGTAGCTGDADTGFECMGVCDTGLEMCTSGELGECTGAVMPAADGMDDCNPDTPTAVDDDCDGAIDEDCDCTEGETQDCYGGPMGTAGQGECAAGTQTCGAEGFGACEGAVLPTAETCGNMGADDDCNGLQDDVPGLGDPCTDDSAQGACRNGTMQCMGGSLTCVTPEPVGDEETSCDGRDEDCDGSVDEDFELFSDPNNCGACGESCGEGLACCDGACVDVSNDDESCGACGESCGMGLSCCGGECVDTTANVAHCGACGDACGDSETCCDGSCANTMTDGSHCGECGRSCMGSQECCGGSCADPDSPACSDCGGCPEGQTCCAGACVDTSTSESHCGACGEDCATGELCCGGSCVPRDTDNCTACGEGCADDGLCCSGECVPSDARNCGECEVMCGSGECCGDSCTDTETDPMHCGECDNPCGSGNCVEGTCCPEEDDAICSGDCTDLDNDDDNCGECGRDCADVLGIPLASCSDRTCS